MKYQSVGEYNETKIKMSCFICLKSLLRLKESVGSKDNSLLRYEYSRMGFKILNKNRKPVPYWKFLINDSNREVIAAAYSSTEERNDNGVHLLNLRKEISEKRAPCKKQTS